ncbi:MAG: PhzF family phenazine biosynthesis isomerase, partial [Pseudomonadota bacterium]
MREINVDIFHAFSDRPDGGSAAGIIDAGETLSANDMQAVARIVGIPACGFITALDHKAIDVRFFSTKTEYPICGHGSVALLTWLIDNKRIAVDHHKGLDVDLRTPAGSAAMRAVSQSDGRHRVSLELQPVFFESCNATASDLARIFSLSEDEFEGATPIEITHSDFTHIIVRLKSLSAMQQLTPDFVAIDRFCRDHCAQTLAVFCTDTVEPESTVHMREFCPTVGTPEAPASGTTNRALGCFIHRHGLFEPNDTG